MDCFVYSNTIKNAFDPTIFEIAKTVNSNPQAMFVADKYYQAYVFKYQDICDFLPTDHEFFNLVNSDILVDENIYRTNCLIYCYLMKKRLSGLPIERVHAYDFDSILPALIIQTAESAKLTLYLHDLPFGFRELDYNDAIEKKRILALACERSDLVQTSSEDLAEFLVEALDTAESKIGIYDPSFLLPERIKGKDDQAALFCRSADFGADRTENMKGFLAALHVSTVFTFGRSQVHRAFLRDFDGLATRLVELEDFCAYNLFLVPLTGILVLHTKFSARVFSVEGEASYFTAYREGGAIALHLEKRQRQLRREGMLAFDRIIIDYLETVRRFLLYRGMDGNRLGNARTIHARSIILWNEKPSGGTPNSAVQKALDQLDGTKIFPIHLDFFDRITMIQYYLISEMNLNFARKAWRRRTTGDILLEIEGEARRDSLAVAAERLAERYRRKIAARQDG